MALTLSFLFALFAAAAVASDPSTPMDLSPPAELSEGDPPIEIGGMGGVYFLAEPGELIVDVLKGSAGGSGRARPLRAILVGPDRRIVEDQVIAAETGADRSANNPSQRIRFSTQVQRKGVYALNITAPGDRYGTATRWGFRTNCAHYLIATARGHRDAAHQEPIVVDSPTRASDVCFLPRQRSFEIEISGLPKTVSTVGVFDAQNQLVKNISVDPQGNANHRVAADSARGDQPWRLHLPVYQATIQIDGVTRWDRRDAYRDLCCWSPRRESWFSLLENRWLVTPYHRTIYQSDGQLIEQSFRIHNNSNAAQNYSLQLEFPEQRWPAQLSQGSVRLNPQASTQVSVSVPASDSHQARSVSLRVTPSETPEFSTYATLSIRPGSPPAAAPLDLPVTLKPYQHENEQYGYLADYPLNNQVYFDQQNRPYVLSKRQLWRKSQGHWVSTDLSSAQREEGVGKAAIRAATSKVAFDRDDDVYLLGRSGGRTVLLHSADQGASFTATAIPAHDSRPSAFDIEQFSGHNVPSGPPPIARFTRTGSDPKLFWRRINELALLLAQKDAGQIHFDDPVAISDQCIGFSAHSGIPSSLVSRGSKVNVAWGEATDPKVEVAGVPGYVASYDRQLKELGQPALVGYGPPANDVHNTPSITNDSDGYLHLLVGTHGQPFPYARSLHPNDAGAGWTDAEPMSQVRQTYVGLVTGTDGTLHAVYRMWRRDTPPHPHGIHAVLAYSRKPPGQPWSSPQPLVVSAFSDYSVFYHRLTIDHDGGLWLSYDYWSTYWFYRNDHVGTRRALMRSSDGGETWYLASGDHAP